MSAVRVTTKRNFLRRIVDNQPFRCASVANYPSKGHRPGVTVQRSAQDQPENRTGKIEDFDGVDAHMTPVLEKGAIIGFQSLRICP
jgi:hypothetical protein